MDNNSHSTTTSTTPPPRKKVKLQDDHQDDTARQDTVAAGSLDGVMDSPYPSLLASRDFKDDALLSSLPNPLLPTLNLPSHDSRAAAQIEKEAEVGISGFVCPDLIGFSGLIKQRYSDFLVNEILPSGEVLHLDSFEIPKLAAKKLEKTTTVKNVDIGTANNAAKHQESEKAAANGELGVKAVTAAIQKDNGVEQNRSEVFLDGASEDSLPMERNPVSESIPSMPMATTLVPEVDTEVLSKKAGSPAQPNVEPAITGPSVVSEEVAVDATPSKLKPHERILPPEQLAEAKAKQEATRGPPATRTRYREIYNPTPLEEPVKPKAEETPEVIKSHTLGAEKEVVPEVLKSYVPDAQREVVPAQGVSGWQQFAKQHTEEHKLTGVDEAELRSYFPTETLAEILTLFLQVVGNVRAPTGGFGVVRAGKIDDRGLRTKIHQALRRIFKGKLESYTDNDGILVISAGQSERTYHNNERGGGRERAGKASDARNSGNVRNSREGQMKQSEKFEALGGSQLHFSVYKENKDTMEVVSWLSKQLHVKPNFFQFAGTKDRRGITVQRLSVQRVFAGDLARAGQSLKNAAIGNYEYHREGLGLGDLSGNEFVITIRECHFPGMPATGVEGQVSYATQIVEILLNHLVEHGFLNFYGLQRFGTFAKRTDVVGTKILQGDYKGAVEAILDFNPESLEAAINHKGTEDKVSRDDKDRAWAINSFLTSGRSKAAIDRLPKKFTAERCIIQHLASNSNDYLGALQIIPRNLRVMYIHAYQSVIWNLAAVHRWELHGKRVVEGDLVLVNEHKAKVKEISINQDIVDQDGEAVIQPPAESDGDRFERARALTAEEACSGQYCIFDVVLPTPGYDILYPTYMVKFYEDTMAKNGGIDPHNMRRSTKDLSLSGSYRKVIVRPGPKHGFQVIPYSQPDEQFVKTDLQRMFEVKSPKETQKASEPKEPQKAHEPQQARTDTELKAEDVRMGEFFDQPRPEAFQKRPVQEIVAKSQPDKLAVVLLLQLGAGQYATMALREFMKGGALTYKPDYGSGR